MLNAKKAVALAIALALTGCAGMQSAAKNAAIQAGLPSGVVSAIDIGAQAAGANALQQAKLEARHEKLLRESTGRTRTGTYDYQATKDSDYELIDVVDKASLRPGECGRLRVEVPVNLLTPVQYIIQQSSTVEGDSAETMVKTNVFYYARCNDGRFVKNRWYSIKMNVLTPDRRLVASKVMQIRFLSI
ncbi:hypothetical protein [Vogesella sp. XCS3]|uniref:hypothetical protein n=1 Tax=Vogesella sp. XCS3 TaxID=2877939 RepID=UPI001D0A1305|nr:hypothetical protein [Vogesella sp. XCS3]UDM18845.1 hypothetical protein LCH97_18415 [Vogesella sp. XCS3]